jgi:anti-anti-sigma factor
MLSQPSLNPTPPLSPADVHHVVIAESLLDADATRTFWRAMEAAFAAGARAVVIDLSRVTFLDSLAISTLVASTRSAPLDTRIALAGLSSYAQKVARVTHLHELFAIYPTKESAFAALTA